MTVETHQLIQDLACTGAAKRDSLVVLLKSDDPTAEALFAAADRVRAESVGDEVHLRALIEFSNHCRRDCLYCGLRRHHDNLPRYRMEPDEIVACAIEAADMGCGTVVLQSGEDLWYTAPVLAEAVRGIKAARDVAVTLSIGERPEEDYRLLREAGADRFLLRIETSSPTLYRRLHPDSDWRKRLGCLSALWRCGFQVGSGVQIGLPGQSLRMLADDLLFLRSLKLDMVGVGPFIAHPETPLAGTRSGTFDLTLRFLACLRLLCPQALIPATTVLAALDPDGWQRGLAAGADVLMPNVTPMEYRRSYEIYPNKVWCDLEPVEFRRLVEEIVARSGRRVAQGPGHSRLRQAASVGPRE